MHCTSGDLVSTMYKVMYGILNTLLVNMGIYKLITLKVRKNVNIIVLEILSLYSFTHMNIVFLTCTNEAHGYKLVWHKNQNVGTHHKIELTTSKQQKKKKNITRFSF